MAHAAPNRLRRLSFGLLTAALLLLVAGLTVLQPRLRGWGFVLYWLACFGLASLALLVALLDLLVVRLRASAARRALYEAEFGKLQVSRQKSEARRPDGKPSRAGPVGDDLPKDLPG
jgi:hypothetical protein